ncbi:MAG: hypothetical protein EAZ53_07335 [Bacteroidetes bacterium]|nr:MAG: hypothetical protein EAZ53_07335 [Bacteroidota bacterium]
MLKDELKNIISGTGKVSHGELIKTTASYLRKSSPTGAMAETKQYNRQKETEKLTEFINKNNLWNCDINFNSFLSEGAEQRVFIKNKNMVLKLNDAIYYTFWLDYLQNLLLHNYFFSDTAYELLGFYKSDANIIYALVSQNYVEATEPTKLENVKEYLLNNGFENTKNHDYYNKSLGIILEDLHDENVLTANGILYFIDTVFYIKNEFYS